MCDEPIKEVAFHLTHIDNLPSIVKHGLHCDNAGRGKVRIGNKGIVRRRATKPVTVDPFGFVGDYAPFYFVPKTRMLWAIVLGGDLPVPGGQDRLIYLLVWIRRITNSSLNWVASDRNAASDCVQFGNTREWLEENIDWDLIRSPRWLCSPPPHAVAQQRMAELLVWNKVPWSAIAGVATRSDEVRQEVIGILRRLRAQKPTRTMTCWYC